ncbi:Putative inner membrane protein [Cellulosimicrobium cellulans]|nr:Putative inner membrane protein [Cellulosimicrobium cellulans]
MNDQRERYALSFTTGGLLEREAAVLALVYAEHRDWRKVRDVAVEGNLLQTRTYRTGVRLVRETVKRMSALEDREVEIIAEVTAAERGHLMWAAACRRYDLIGEFAEEVLRERFLTLAGTVAYEDYDSFYRAKAMWHDELDSISAATYKKLRQVLFKMMVEAGLLTTMGAIEPALLSARIAECLTERTPSDIRFFPTREA